MSVFDKKITCSGCPNGIAMCLMTPCTGTPGDIQTIIESGHAKSLMIVRHYNMIAALSGNVAFTEILIPAMVDFEGKQVDAFVTGQRPCTFLTPDFKCGIHAIKPRIGAISCCKTEPDNELYKQINETWNSEAGRALVAIWKELVDYDESRDSLGLQQIKMLEQLLKNF